MNLCIIVAIGKDRSIGRDGDLAFHIRADLRRFKELTMGHPVIMGRKTFESLPKGALPGRRNIVITRNAGFTAPNVETASSLEDAINMVEGVEKAFVIGGASVYVQALPLVDTLDLTMIDAECPGADTFFPEWDNGEWTLVSKSPEAVDEASGLGYCFAEYSRSK